ncbi:MAG: FecR domain-containing protein [Bacteroidota bacterium]
MKSSKTELLRRFLAGQCTHDEVHELMTWMNGKEFNREFGAHIEKELTAFSQEGEQPQVPADDSIYETIWKEIRASEEKGPHRLELSIADPPTVSRKPAVSMRMIMAVAATVALVVVAFWFGRTYEHENQVAEELRPAATVKAARKGQKLTVMLNDSSIIKLNAGSTLTYFKETFNQRREVWLSGEAYFDVVSDPARPFTVVTPREMIVKVLGTSFCVDTHGFEGVGAVAVRSGKVEVSQHGVEDKLLLNRGERTLLRSDGSLRKARIAQEDLIFGWVDNRLVFHENGIAEIIEKIDAWYGREIELGDDLSVNDTFTGAFDNPTLDEVLESVCHAFKLIYTYENERIVIRR